MRQKYLQKQFYQLAKKNILKPGDETNRLPCIEPIQRVDLNQSLWDNLVLLKALMETSKPD